MLSTTLDFDSQKNTSFTLKTKEISFIIIYHQIQATVYYSCLVNSRLRWYETAIHVSCSKIVKCFPFSPPTQILIWSFHNFSWNTVSTQRQDLWIIFQALSICFQHISYVHLVSHIWNSLIVALNLQGPISPTCNAQLLAPKSAKKTNGLTAFFAFGICVSNSCA